MAKIFLSYSHVDEEFRKQLETHLALLKRQGIVEVWHDRRIEAGRDIHHSIDQNLETSDIILLLVSADFLASDYCYDVEMDRALEKHSAGTARVIPVILRSCDWQSSPFGMLRATPTDGKPISKFPDRDDAYLEVVRDIRRAAEGLGEAAAPRITAAPTASSSPVLGQMSAPSVQREHRSSNLRVKREATDREKDKFLTESFEFMSNYFENSLRELEERNPEIETEFRRIDANHFTAATYRHGSVASECKIWLSTGRGGFFANGILYSHDRASSDNSCSNWLTIQDDGYGLSFRLGNLSFGRDSDKHLTQEGAAEYYWSSFIEALQR